MIKNWKKEVARDLMAFGSLPFYFIVFIRSIIGHSTAFTYNLVIGFLILSIFSYFVRDADYYIARAFIMLMYVCFFYMNLLFTLFAFLLYIFIVIAAVYLHIPRKEIAGGILTGFFSALISGLSYYLIFMV